MVEDPLPRLPKPVDHPETLFDHVGNYDVGYDYDEGVKLEKNRVDLISAWEEGTPSEEFCEYTTQAPHIHRPCGQQYHQ